MSPRRVAWVLLGLAACTADDAKDGDTDVAEETDSVPGETDLGDTDDTDATDSDVVDTTDSDPAETDTIDTDLGETDAVETDGVDTDAADSDPPGGADTAAIEPGVHGVPLVSPTRRARIVVADLTAAGFPWAAEVRTGSPGVEGVTRRLRVPRVGLDACGVYDLFPQAGAPEVFEDAGVVELGDPTGAWDDFPLSQACDPVLGCYVDGYGAQYFLPGGMEGLDLAVVPGGLYGARAAGAAFPAFNVPIAFRFPSASLVISADAAWDGVSDLAFTWGPGSGRDRLHLTLSAGGGAVLDCVFFDDGDGVVPAASLAELGAAPIVNWTAARQQLWHHRIDADTELVVEASSSVTGFQRVP